MLDHHATNLTRRISQRSLLPATIKNRHLGQIVLSSNTAVATTSLNSGQQVVFSITTAALGDPRIFCAPDISLYQGSAALSNLIPTGANVTATDYQVVFMGNDLLATNGQNTVTRVFLRNLSAGLQTILIQTKSRVIAGSGL